LEQHNGDRKAAQGGYSRKGSEGTEEETHAARASAIHHCRLGACTRPGSSRGAPHRKRPWRQSQPGTRRVEKSAARVVCHRVATTLPRPSWV